MNVQDLIEQANYSLYGLPSGDINVFLNGSWSGNISTSSSSVYYLTNFSQDAFLFLLEVSDRLSHPEIEVYLSVYFNGNNSGRIFLALLFSVSAACSSAWMLTLLFYLSPKHKVKPILTQIATILSAVLFTILISKLTKISETQYYAGEINVRDMANHMYDNVVNMILQVLTASLNRLAMLNIISKISKPEMKLWNLSIGACFMLTSVIMNAYVSIVFSELRVFLDNSPQAEYFLKAHSGIEVCIDFWILWSLLYYMLFMQEFRTTSFSRYLIPLAICNLLIIVGHMTIQLMAASDYAAEFFFYKFPHIVCQILDVLLLTTVWEWISNNRFLERKIEMRGVLGRRVSIDDVLVEIDKQDPSSRVLRWVSLIPALFTHRIKADDVTEVTSHKETNKDSLVDFLKLSTRTTWSLNPSGGNRMEHSSGPSTAVATASMLQPSRNQTANTNPVTNPTMNPTPNTNPTRNATPSANATPNPPDSARQETDSESDEEYEIQETGSFDEFYTDPLDLEITHQVEANPPPPFSVQSGFNPGDYWDDKR